MVYLHVPACVFTSLKATEWSVSVTNTDLKQQADLRCGTLNVGSLLHNKCTFVADLDILIHFKIWHQSPTDLALLRSAPSGFNDIQPSGFNIVEKDLHLLTSHRGGRGLVIFHHRNTQVKQIKLTETFKTFKVLGVPLKHFKSAHYRCTLPHSGVGSLCLLMHWTILMVQCTISTIKLLKHFVTDSSRNSLKPS